MFETKQQSNFDDVGDFHEKFELDNTTHQDIGPRTQLDPTIIPFRVKFMLEELQEFCDGAGIVITHSRLFETIRLDELVLEDHSKEGAGVDHAQTFDALIDLVYVAMGTAHFLGYPWQMGWRLVQRANMSKVRAQKDASDSKRGSSFDVVKPQGWYPPNIGRLLSRIGFDIPNEGTQVPNFEGLGEDTNHPMEPNR